MKKLICTAGLPGAGKGIFVKAAEEMMIPVYIMGDIVREKTRERYGVDNSYYTGLYMREMREIYGRDIVAKLTIDKIESDEEEAQYILIDGVRNIDEINYFVDRGYKVIIIGVIASLHTRYKRIVERGREDDVKNLSEFIVRENREREIGLTDVINQADYYLINEDMEEEESIEKAIVIMKKIMSGED